MVSHQERYRDAAQVRAMQYGNILHYAMSLVFQAPDVHKATKQLLREGMLRSDETETFKERLERIVAHPQLADYYGPENRVLNEQEILTKNGVILRPDRVVISEKKAVIMDYKTGKPEEKHRYQIIEYCDALKEMGYSVEAAIAIYVNENLVTPEFI
jgi:CRISPR/Cas system-associated exonuclease Cas4 (RecB family)